MEAISEAHAYYASASDYSHFLVLTQSCDLVRRDSSRPKSRYITICAVRPLTVAVDREMEKFAKAMPGFPIPVGDSSRGVLARQYLDRVLNNNIEGHFFIPRGSSERIDRHLCAFLPLSIALRADHYNVCLSSKIAQAEEIFAAKIGSLASGLYSRIATPDLHERNNPQIVDKYREEFFQELGYRKVAWLTEEQKKSLKKKLKEIQEVNGGVDISEDDASKIVAELEGEAEKIADRVVDILKSRKLLQDVTEVEDRARSFILNDPTFRRLAKR